MYFFFLLTSQIITISKGAILTSPTCHGTGCFFAPPRKSVHILGARNKNSNPRLAPMTISLQFFTFGQNQQVVYDSVLNGKFGPII